MDLSDRDLVQICKTILRCNESVIISIDERNLLRQVVEVNKTDCFIRSLLVEGEHSLGILGLDVNILVLY